MEDINAWSKGNLLKVFSTILLNPEFHAVTNYRIAHSISKIPLLIPIAKIITYFNKVLFSVDIDYRAKIGGGFRLVHGLGTVIGAEVIIGRNVSIYQGVTLGGSQGKRKNLRGTLTGQPIIDEDVVIYSNCTIFGPIIIENSVVVGENSIVNRDIPSGSLVYNKHDLIITL